MLCMFKTRITTLGVELEFLYTGGTILNRQIDHIKVIIQNFTIFSETLVCSNVVLKEAEETIGPVKGPIIMKRRTRF